MKVDKHLGLGKYHKNMKTKKKTMIKNREKVTNLIFTNAKKS